jgi:hypothetical protein
VLRYGISNLKKTLVVPKILCPDFSVLLPANEDAAPICVQHNVKIILKKN